MFAPNRWIPSRTSRQFLYDEEGRMKEFNLSRESTGGLGDANSLFATEAERFDSVAPHLALNRSKDAGRRNYVIQPGGRCIYFSEPAKMDDPYGGGRVQYTMPDPKTSFGHDSLDATKLADPVRTGFSTRRT